MQNIKINMASVKLFIIRKTNKKFYTLYLHIWSIRFFQNQPISYSFFKCFCSSRTWVRHIWSVIQSPKDLFKSVSLFFSRQLINIKHVTLVVIIRMTVFSLFLDFFVNRVFALGKMNLISFIEHNFFQSLSKIGTSWKIFNQNQWKIELKNKLSVTSQESPSQRLANHHPSPPTRPALHLWSIRALRCVHNVLQQSVSVSTS